MEARAAAPLIILCLVVPFAGLAQNHPDQHVVLRIEEILQDVETLDGLALGDDGTCLQLLPDRTGGTLVLKPKTVPHPFNRGLPSWNGSAPDARSAFKVEMRFPSGAGWSPWLTVGYWKVYGWSYYGATSYSGGLVDIDYVKLNSYVTGWQFRITMSRTGVSEPSPTLHKLSFFVSDSRTTTSQDLSQILIDRPEAIFIPTDFIYQNEVDPDIGGSICSPTSVSMILRSYGIPVDPLQFARDTYDPQFGIFGVWPRVVQNAAEYGLDGAVTRYRTWSEARAVLAGGGRISMSVGPPLYSGHLMMLAGFTEAGDPIVHDPAKSNGYAYVYDKADVSKSWFDKGGIAYTFYPAEGATTSIDTRPEQRTVAEGFRLYQNYPNPFNPSTTIRFSVPARSRVDLTVHNMLGEQVRELVDGEVEAGHHEAVFDASGLASGVYLYRLRVRGSDTDSPRDSKGAAPGFVQTKRLVVLR